MNPYLAQYQELEVIGRGSFGSATLVREHASGAMFIAKKIIMSGLKQKEQESAKQESELLKSLKHPNIVGYKDSFMIDGTLIIIMEFCEEGDLAFHIKRKKEKGEHFSERVILNWFLQISLALIYIHEKKILHRDIKTSNIFVNSNGTVKIGDFGISRVLENTTDQAQTVVGTPYYMSPEVCESKPYSQKSDVWALACVVYELCTLKHAFTSNNLLGLVYKIVKETVEEIPEFYSADLKNLIKKMFVKDDTIRPSIRQVLAQPFIVKTMEEFVENQGKNIYQSEIPIKQTYTHAQMLTKNQQSVNSESSGHDSELGDTVQSMNQSGKNQTKFTIGDTINSMNNSGTMFQNNNNYDNTLGSTVMSIQAGGATTAMGGNNPMETMTTKQKLALKKQQESDAKAAILNQAVRENASQAHLVKARQQEQLRHHHGNMASTGKNLQTMQQLQQKEQMYYNQQHQQQMNSQTMRVTGSSQVVPNNNNNNVRWGNHQQQYQAAGDLGEITAGLSNASISQFQNQPFDISHNKMPMYNVPQGYGQNPQKGNDYEQQYQEEFEEYNSDGENEDEYNNTFSLTQTQNRLTLRAPESQREDVVNVYKDLLKQKNKAGQLDDISEQSGEYVMTPQKSSAKTGGSTSAMSASGVQPGQPKSKIEKLKQECLSSMSEDLFTKAYNFIKSRKRMTEEDQRALNDLVGKQNVSKCLKIDELIYLESLN